MKKFLFLAIAATAMTSCSQDEVLEVAQKQAISFGEAFVGNATRAIDPSYGTSKKIEKFTAYGNLTHNNEFVKLYGGNGVEATGSTYGEAYTTTDTEYWTPGVTYNFVAVVNNSSIKLDKTTGLPTEIGFTHSDNGNVDLLYTKTGNEVKTNESATPTTGVNDKGIVNFTFNHLLAKLQFNFINESKDSRNIFKVKSIQISGLPTSGTYTVVDEGWADTGTTGTANFGDASDATTTTATAVDIMTTNTTGISSDQARLVIPNDNALTITFVKELYYDTNGNNKADDTELIYTDEKTTAKKTTITLTGQTFAANGNYVLTAKLGAETNKPIQFTVDKLNKWDDETIVTIAPAN